MTRALAVAWVFCYLTGGCAASDRYDSASGTVTPQTYVVRAHDTLYSIAWRNDVDYRQLARWNHLGTDFKLAVGQVLVLRPTDRSSTPAPPLPSAPRPVAGPATPVTTPGAAAATHPPPVGATSVPATVAGAKWVWPTDRVSAPRPVPGGGVLLLGRLGQDIRAAGSGRVVYTGSGLRGYGNLIIIKHGDSLLSSYAHNQELLVHEGQEVAMGQVIAHMGTGPHQVCALYFEIRVNGKPTDPLRYLSTDR